MPLSPGQTLNNRYRIVEMLGQGGFGAVYRAWDTNLDRACAIKENLDTSPDSQRQFKREAQILSNLSHANLPRVSDHFVIPGQGQYLVMDYIEGEDLGELLQRAGGPLPEAHALEWIDQICDALVYLHSRNPPIIHRDIKPANIKITPSGKAVLVDFGIAKVYYSNVQTTTGARAVTLGYSPPEQYGLGTTDARSDIYALGATTYHLLTGQQPPASVDVVAKAILPPRLVHELNPVISEAISAAVEKAMHVERPARWGNVIEFRAALAVAQSGGVSSSASAGRRSFTIPDQAVLASTTAQPPPIPLTSTVVIPSQHKQLWGWIGIICVLVLGGLYAVLNSRSLPFVPFSTQTFLVVITPSSFALAVTPLAKPSQTFTPTPLRFPTPLPISVTPVFTTSPSPTNLPAFISPNDVPMALIPASEFQMGAGSGLSRERPIHAVHLDDFYIDVYEVTNSRYTECVQAGACSEPGCVYCQRPEYESHPVVSVDWSQAQLYCEWRGTRLPTEAEWEKAARGGLEGMLYPWGNDKPSCRPGDLHGAQTAECGGQTTPGHTLPVGSFSANAYGLYDMLGNVMEWVADWYLDTYYYQSPSSNPEGPQSGTDRIARGGAWFTYLNISMISFRRPVDPVERLSYLGFRCARMP